MRLQAHPERDVSEDLNVEHGDFLKYHTDPAARIPQIDRRADDIGTV
jgi:hypothetical protein